MDSGFQTQSGEVPLHCFFLGSRCLRGRCLSPGSVERQTRSSCLGFHGESNMMCLPPSLKDTVYLQPTYLGDPLSLPDGKYHFLETQLPFQLYKGNPMIKSEEVCCTRGSGKSGSEVGRPGSWLTTDWEPRVRGID